MRECAQVALLHAANGFNICRSGRAGRETDESSADAHFCLFCNLGEQRMTESPHVVVRISPNDERAERTLELALII